MSDPIHLHIDGPVGRIVFDRPEALNAIDLATARAFEAAVMRAVATPGLRVLILSGSGRAFMAGGDLAAFHAAADPAALAEAIITPMHRALAALHGSALVTLALVQGAAAGAGLSLALAADLCIADDSAVFSFAYLRIGAPADCGITWTLPRSIGLRRALWLAIEGSAVRAEAALALGLISEVTAPDQLEPRGRALAARLATLPAAAVADLRQLMRGSFDRDFGAALSAEQAAFTRAAGSADFAACVAAFLDKRKPRPSGSPDSGPQPGGIPG